MTKLVRDGDRLNVTVRCFAVAHEHGVIARCVDLNLAVIRPTADDARRELSKQILLYVRSALEHGESLHRPARATVFATYYLLVALHQARRLRSTLLRPADVWRERALPLAA
jgi:hypothetical protein